MIGLWSIVTLALGGNALVLTVDDGGDGQARWTSRALGVSGEVAATDAFEADQLRLRSRECFKAPSDKQAAVLREAATKADKVYVVLDTASSKERLAWRWDGTRLSRVVHRPTRAHADLGSASVLGLSWPGQEDGERLAGGLEQVYGIHATSRTHLEGDQAVDLIDQLMEHPNECSAVLSAANLEALGALSQADEPLLVAVQVPSERTPKVWRWDPEQEALWLQLQR
jgi:hypothetical protein